jgi:hypothetical protein
MEKEKQYRELIADVKRFYENEARLHQHEPLYLGWYDECKEINLWTYWQGRGCLGTRIMLVGQDWGSPGECSESYMSQFEEFNCGGRSAYRMEGTSITDEHLIALFSSLGLGYDISDGRPHNPDLFFTNFVLGYRNKGFSGGFKQRWLRENKDFFRRLAEIIEPEIIICLGRNAFHGVMMGYGQKVRFRSYNAFIVSKENPVELSFPSGKRAYVFAEAHCGAMGTLNRSRLKDPKGITGLKLQEKDWQHIREYLAKT